MKRILSIGLSIISALTFVISATGCAVQDWANQTFCEHVYDDGKITKEATCKEEGEITSTCTLCGKEDVEKIEKTAHLELYVASKNATCAEKGHTDYVKCKVCDTVIVAPTDIPVLGHKIVEDAEVKATCLASGLTKGEHCEVCGEIFVEQVVTSATGHSLVVVEGRLSTCVAAGLTPGIKCENCNEFFAEQEELPILAHNYVDGICSSCGFVEYVGNNEENYNLVKMNNGDKFEKGWYRFAFAMDGVSSFVIKGFSYSGLELIINEDISLSFTTNGFESSFERGESDYVEVDFNIVETATYVDIYITEDLTFDLFVYVDDVTVEKIEVPFSSNVYLDRVSTSGSETFVYRIERIK